MATPYFQMSLDEVPSTQDVARGHLGPLPMVVISRSQTAGRGRSSAGWLNADVATAVSVAFVPADDETRPLSLMAGVAAVRSTDGTRLKWPNDVTLAGSKVGGILVERNEDSVVIGLGLNVFWPDAPNGIGALRDVAPDPNAGEEIAALWAAELVALVAEPGWPIDEYRAVCDTLRHDITWEPAGAGRAVDVDEDGALVVESAGIRQRVVAGAVRHVRPVGG